MLHSGSISLLCYVQVWCCGSLFNTVLGDPRAVEFRLVVTEQSWGAVPGCPGLTEENGLFLLPEVGHLTPRCRFRILGCLLPRSSDPVRQESTFSSSLLCLFYLPCVCLLSQHCSGCLEKYWGSFRLTGRMVSSQNCPSCPVIWRGERVLCWFYFPSSPWLWGPGLNCGKYAVVWPSYSWYLLYCLCLICGVYII